MRPCLTCREDLDSLGKRRQALYCSIPCKQKARDTRRSKGEYPNYNENYLTRPQGKALHLYHAAHRRAKVNKLDFTITPEWIQEQLDIGICSITGLPFIFSYGEGKKPWSPSLDRIDPNKGYTIENTRLVIWLYNAAKNVFTDEDVLLMAKALLTNSKGGIK